MDVEAEKEDKTMREEKEEDLGRKDIFEGYLR